MVHSSRKASYPAGVERAPQLHAQLTGPACPSRDPARLLCSLTYLLSLGPGGMSHPTRPSPRGACSSSQGACAFLSWEKKVPLVFVCFVLFSNEWVYGRLKHLERRRCLIKRQKRNTIWGKKTHSSSISDFLSLKTAHPNSTFKLAWQILRIASHSSTHMLKTVLRRNHEGRGATKNAWMLPHVKLHLACPEGRTPVTLGQGTRHRAGASE